VSREALRSSSQPFICEGWVSGLFLTSITDRVGLNKPYTSPNSTRSPSSSLHLARQVMSLGRVRLLSPWALLSLRGMSLLDRKPGRRISRAICHSLVSSPRVPGIVKDYGRDSNSRFSLIAHISFAVSGKTQRHSRYTNDSFDKVVNSSSTHFEPPKRIVWLLGGLA
jgi:hypothetical protein